MKADVISRLVPITSFNKGHASKIFDRAKSIGPLFVLKNNSPEAVIVSPDDYIRMSEAEENYALLLEATERLNNQPNKQAYSMEDVMAEFGLTSDDLAEINEVELA